MNSLAHVHEIDLSPLPQNSGLSGRDRRKLPGRRSIVYTNGSRGHAQRVTDYMGLSHVFDGQFAIEDSDFIPKPNQSSYDAFNLKKYGIDPRQVSVFFEDLARNLDASAKRWALQRCSCNLSKDWSHEPAAARPAGIGDDLPLHIDYVTRDLTQFLSNRLTQ